MSRKKKTETSTSGEIQAVPPVPLPEGWRQETGKDRRVYTYNEKGELRCGSYNPKRMKYCNNPPLDGRNRCYYHGGESPRGIASPHFRSGRYSLDAPAYMLERYEAALEHDEILSMRDEVALAEARISELLKRVDSGESGSTWRLLKKTYREMVAAINEKDQIKTSLLMSEIGRLINKGLADYMAWDDLAKWMNRKEHYARSERKRLVEGQQVIYTEQVMVVIARLSDAIKRHVKDRETLSALSEELRQVLRNKQGV